MGNEYENREFANVCGNLGMDTEDRSGFHRYLANNYSLEKDYMEYWDLMKVGVEYLRYIGRWVPEEYQSL